MEKTMKSNYLRKGQTYDRRPRGIRIYDYQLQKAKNFIKSGQWKPICPVCKTPSITPKLVKPNPNLLDVRLKR